MPPSSPRRVVLVHVALALLLAAAPAQEVRCELGSVDRDARAAKVGATLPAAGKEAIELFLPRWSPGSYVVQNHHERVLDFAAAAADKPLAVTRPQPNRWRIVTAAAAAITVTYTLRRTRPSVTENQIADTFAVFCGDRAVRSCAELDYGEALEWFGLEFEPAPDEAPRNQRWRLREHKEATTTQREHLRALLTPPPPPADAAVGK